MLFCTFLYCHCTTTTWNRVWKGIFGIRDLTKIWCGNRENDKYIDRIRDLTVPREAGLAENWALDAGFMFRVRRECWKPLKTRVNSKYQSKGSTYILHLLAFVEIRFFNVFFLERKAVFGKLMKNMGDAGFLRKRGQNVGSGPPLPDPGETS